MFQVITMWNFARPDLETKNSVENIELRGYNSKAFLTGQFALKIKNGELRSLSVSDIADRYCPARRDLYYKKGMNKPKIRSSTTWGGKAGTIVEEFLFGLFSKKKSKGNRKMYEIIRKTSDQFSKSFQRSQNNGFKILSQLKGGDYEDPKRLLELLNNNGRAELGMKLLHTLIFDNRKDVSFSHLALKTDSSLQLNPNPAEIGISSPAEPDFLIKKYQVIGDIKSGIEFKNFHQLTCAGYALAYENEKKKHINWGIIYFFPTRNPSAYVRPITFAQIYIFPIDDNLRRWFLDFRDQDYGTISKNRPPKFPQVKNGQHCSHCKFNDPCKNQGLKV